MNILNHFNRHAVLLTGALLLCASIGAYADDIEDANQLFKQGQRSQALDKVNGYLANKPKDAQARFLKGLIPVSYTHLDVYKRQVPQCAKKIPY